MAEGEADGVAGAVEIEGVLENLRALSGEISTAAVLSGEGEVRAATVPPGVDRERYAAMISALAGLSRRTARENGGGAFTQTRVKVEEGHVLLVGLENGDTLAATAGPDARVGLVLYDMRAARRDLERTLGLGEDRAENGEMGDDEIEDEGGSEIGGPGERKQ